MTIIFSNIEADISNDLINTFPPEFEFEVMLKKICEESGLVLFHHQVSEGGVRIQKYRLKGLWQCMTKAYSHLDCVLSENHKYVSNTTGGNHVSNKKEGCFAGDSKDSYTANFEHEGHLGVSASEMFHDMCAGSEREIKRPHITESVREKDFQCEVEKTKSSVCIKPKDNEFSDEENIVVDELNDDLIYEKLPESSEGKPAANEITNVVVVNKQMSTSLDNESLESVPTPNSKMIKTGKLKRNIRKKKMSTISSSKSVSGKRNLDKIELSCTECDYKSSKKLSLKKHILEEHPSLQKQEHTIHFSGPSGCDKCSKVFPSRKFMLRHRASHKEPQHCCDGCGKMYKIRIAMIEHSKIHDVNYKKTFFKCEQCTRQFSNRYLLECHFRDIHLGLKKSFLCSVCGKSFTTKHSLREHSNAHTGIKPHICEVCGKSFSYESALRDHLFTHEETKQFWCKHCDKGFTQRSGLKMHMRTHTLEKMFTCDECGRGFTQKQALQRHERVHKGEKPFICKHCGRFFTDASIIRRHIILVHKIKKGSKEWREDIICTTKLAKTESEFRVQKIGEEEVFAEQAEKVKKEIIEFVGQQPKPTPPSRGPSRAFSRIYPRRVALLDDKGNIIAPPEPQQTPKAKTRQTHAKTKSKAEKSELNVKSSSSTSPFLKSITIKEHSTGNDGTLTTPIPILLHPSSSSSSSVFPSFHSASGNSVDLDSSGQGVSARFLDASQWNSLTSHLRSGANATHIEHIILEDPSQADGQQDIESTSSVLPKIIKYENLANLSSASSSGLSLSQAQSQSEHQSPSSSPMSFVTHHEGPSTSKPQLDVHFDPHAAATQVYDGRADSRSNPNTVQWSSMFYYSQLASQLGMTLVSHAPEASPNSALILQPTSNNGTHMDSQGRLGSHDMSSLSQAGQSALSQVVAIPTLSASDAMNIQSQDMLQLRAAPAHIKMDSWPDGAVGLPQANLLMQTHLAPQPLSGHSHHMTTMEDVAAGLDSRLEGHMHLSRGSGGKAVFESP